MLKYLFFIILLFNLGCEIEQFKVTDKYLSPISNKCVYILRYTHGSRIYHIAAEYDCGQYEVNQFVTTCDSIDLVESLECFQPENLTFR